MFTFILILNEKKIERKEERERDREKKRSKYNIFLIFLILINRLKKQLIMNGLVLAKRVQFV